jgi:hypothetical protein
LEKKAKISDLKSGGTASVVIPEDESPPSSTTPLLLSPQQAQVNQQIQPTRTRSAAQNMVQSFFFIFANIIFPIFFGFILMYCKLFNC